MTNYDEVFDAYGAAKYLGIHLQTVRRFAREKRIPAYRVGNVWRFKRQSLDVWTQSQERQSTSNRVLVVDDDQAILDIISQTLRSNGFSVNLALSGAEALECLRHEVPDVVLLDLKLPEMSGPEVLKEIRQKYGQIPVIIITGYPDSEMMSQALQYSPIMMISKPFMPEKILETVSLVLNGSRAGTTIGKGSQEEAGLTL